MYTTGYTTSFGVEENDIFLVKWDTDGNEIGYRTWGGSDNDIGQSIWGDGTYLYIVGCTESSFVDEKSLLLLKMYKEILQEPVLQPISPNPNLDGNITLNWNEVVDATSYDLYRNKSAIFDISLVTPFSTSVSPSYTDVNLTNGTYYYAVVAKNGNRESDLSNCESVKVEITDPPENRISGFPFEFIISIWGISVVLLMLKKRICINDTL